MAVIWAVGCGTLGEIFIHFQVLYNTFPEQILFKKQPISGSYVGTHERSFLYKNNTNLGAITSIQAIYFP